MGTSNPVRAGQIAKGGIGLGIVGMLLAAVWMVVVYGGVVG